jgi:hypothetical protein
MEMLGMKDTAQAGVLEYQRRQAGVTILAPLFDSLRRYRVAQGRMMLKVIQTYLADDRLIRIVNADQVRYLPLNRDLVMGEYDVIVDEAPSSPNAKDRNFAIIQSLWPMLQGVMNPEIAGEIVTYSPLPETLASKIREGLAAPQSPPPPPPPDPRLVAIEAKMIEADKDRQFKAFMAEQEMMFKAQMAQMKAQADAMVERERLDRQIGVEIAQGEADAAVQNMKAASEIDIARRKFELERELKLLDFELKQRQDAMSAPVMVSPIIQ